MGWGLGGVWIPDLPSAPLPKPEQSPGLPAAGDAPVQTAESGRCIPIVYGTSRIAGNLLEKKAPVGLFITRNPLTGEYYLPVWTAETDYYYHDVVINAAAGGIYICTTEGTSGAIGSSGPTGDGTDITDGTCEWARMTTGHWQRFVIGICEGEIAGIGKAWEDKHRYTDYHDIPKVLGSLELRRGEASQARPTFAVSTLTSPAPPWEYSNTAVLYLSQLTGSMSATPNLSFEVQGILFGGAGPDVSPADIATDLLTHTRRGLGIPAARIDSDSTGSGVRSWRTYCTAAGLNLSWAIESQESTLSLLQKLLLATNTDCVWSGGKFKFVPLGNEAITANGVTYTPPTTPEYALGPDDFLEPIKVRRKRPADCFNSWPVQYRRRDRDYGIDIVSDPDMADVEARVTASEDGLRPARITVLGTEVSGIVLDPSSATMLSRILAQRSLKVRNVYTVTVGIRYALLEPTDLITIADPLLGLDAVPVRIVEMEEAIDQDGRAAFVLVCEDWPASVAHAARYAPQAGDGWTYYPDERDPVNGIVLGPGQLDTSSATYDKLTIGAIADNLWPNPMSEIAPPDGADDTSAEWAYVEAVADAYSGAKVRRLTAGGSAVATGITIPCAPGDRLYFAAQARMNTGTLGGGVSIIWRDSDGAQVGDEVYDVTTSATWEQVAASGAAPADTVAAYLSIFAYADGETDFDAIYARRMVDMGSLAAWPCAGRVAADATMIAQSGMITATSEFQTDPGVYYVTVDGLTEDAIVLVTLGTGSLDISVGVVVNPAGGGFWVYTSGGGVAFNAAFTFLVISL